MMFSKVVNLYRFAGRPEVKDNTFSYEGGYQPDLAALVDECRQLPQHYGRMLESECTEQEGCSFTYMLPSSEHGKFFLNTAALIAGATSLNKGVFPSNIYVVDIDWADFDQGEQPVISSLKVLCRLVELLAELAIGVDRETSRSFYNLFFALPQDGVKPPRSFLVSTKITVEMLGYEVRHLELLEQVLSPKHANKPNQLERLMMFRLSIADVLESVPEIDQALFYIVRDWGLILSQYRINLQSYVYGFSFEKVRQEVARAELEYAKSLSSILGDIAGKLLALPVSLAGLVLLNKSSDPLEVVVLVAGVLVVSYILLSTINNQKIQVQRLTHSFEMVFDGFKSRMHTYPKKMKELLAQAAEQLNRQVTSLDTTFSVLAKLSWVPVWGAAFICGGKLVSYLCGA